MAGDFRWWREELASGRVALFTGAGFSHGALDRRGRPLPTSDELARELWSLCFGDEPYDDESTLADLYDVATLRDPERLAAHLGERLRVGDAPLPRQHERFFRVPWRRIYTLNVDDLERVAERQLRLPRPLDVVHLNGDIDDDHRALTFSTLQYAARVDEIDPLYRQLGHELRQAPFVFVGTCLDEVPLWRHVQRHGERGTGVQPHRPPSLLVTPHVARARRCLLEAFNVRWVAMTAEAFADEVLVE